MDTCGSWINFACSRGHMLVLRWLAQKFKTSRTGMTTRHRNRPSRKTLCPRTTASKNPGRAFLRPCFFLPVFFRGVFFFFETSFFFESSRQGFFGHGFFFETYFFSFRPSPSASRPCHVVFDTSSFPFAQLRSSHCHVRHEGTEILTKQPPGRHFFCARLMPSVTLKQPWSWMRRTIWRSRWKGD